MVMECPISNISQSYEDMRIHEKKSGKQSADDLISKPLFDHGKMIFENSTCHCFSKSFEMPTVELS